MDNIFSLKGCLALKQENYEQVKLVIEQVAALEDKIFIQATKDIFLMSIRRHKEEMLLEWFDIVDARLKVILGKENFFMECQNFLEAMLFSICDHRLECFHNRFTEYMAIFQTGQQDIWKMEKFYIELSSLAARMSLRKWDKQAQWILEMVLESVSNQKNLEFVQHILYHIDMNSVMYAKNYGSGTMFILYQQAQFSYACLLNYLENDDLDRREQKKALTIAVRGERNLMSNLARITMKDEMEVYEEWYHHMLYIFGKNEKLKLMAILLVQLTIMYWNKTQPKTSRKQVGYLKKILEPTYIKGNFSELLEEIS